MANNPAEMQATDPGQKVVDNVVCPLHDSIGEGEKTHIILVGCGECDGRHKTKCFGGDMSRPEHRMEEVVQASACRSLVS